MKQVDKDLEESNLLNLNHQISKLLTSTDTLNRTLNDLISICCKIDGINGGSIYLVDRLTDGLRLVSHFGLGADIIKEVSSYDFSTLETRLVKMAEPIYFCTSEMKDNIFSIKTMEGQGLLSFTLIPVVYDDIVVAAMNLFSFETDRISLNKRLALEAFAMRIGAIVTRVNAVHASQESERRYLLLLETMNEGFLVIDENSIVTYGNNRICEMLGYRFDEILGLPVSFFFDEKNKRVLQKQMRNRGSGQDLFYEITWQQADGEPITTKVAPRAIRDDHGIFKGSFAVITDVTEIKETNNRLRSKERDLVEKTINLQEVNTALRVLLKKRDEDKNEIEEKLVRNVEQLIFPLLSKIKERSLSSSQKSLFEILESSLSNIVSPYSKNLFARHLELTTAEFDIANFIREGKSTKEIAEIMSLSIRTIETHRFKIRKKLNLNNRKINLRSYLLSLQ